MIIGVLTKPADARWASIYQYRSFRGSSFYGEPLANATWFCAENTSSCPECLSCCASSNFKRGSKGYNACVHRCKRKFTGDQCTASSGGGGGVPAPDPPPGAEQCPVVCVPDGTGVTCNYNCMGMSMNIINTDVPGEVIPLQQAKSLFNRQAWLSQTHPSSWGASYLPTGAGTYIPPTDTGGGILDTVTSNLPMIALVGGGLFLVTKFMK